MKRILVVGAGGFTGGFIVGEGLRRGYEVWAGVRASTSRAFLQDSRIHFLETGFPEQRKSVRIIARRIARRRTLGLYHI